MARIDRRMFIWMKREHRPRFKVEIINNGTTYTYGSNDTNSLIFAEWRKIVTEAVGDFKIRLSNISGDLSNLFEKDDAVRIYANNTDGTTKVFEGYLDFPREKDDKKGRFIEVIGKHISGQLLDVHVSKNYNNTEVSAVLEDMIDNFAPAGYTKTNINTTTVTDSFNFQDKPFWECVIDLCKRADFDCYVDDDKDFHFFEKGSIEITNDAIVLGANLRSIKGLGIDTHYTRNQVRVYGQDDTGLPIVYTTPEITGERKREVIFKDSNLRTIEQVKAFANAKLDDLELENNEATAMSLGLPNANPGEKIWIIDNRIKVHGTFRILELKHRIGSIGWITTTTIEKETKATPEIFRERIRREQFLQNTTNINNLDYSYNFTFDDDSQILSHSGTETSEGKLRIKAGQTTGTMISKSVDADNNVTQVEIKYEGIQDLNTSLFWISVDNGLSWESVTRNTLLNVAGAGKRLKIKVELNSDTKNTNPSIDSLVVLYS